jgi:molybdate transport system substrate-binding protein
MPSRRRLAVLPVIAALLAVLAASLAPAAAQERPFTVFAAASLKNALDAVNAVFEARGGPKVMVSYAASSALARQIEAGAPVDVLICADRDWMAYLKDRKLIAPGSDFALLGNRLVLIAPKDSSVSLPIAAGFPLAAALGDGRLATADVASVPAGRYAKAALAALGVWGAVEGRLAQAENVRAALKLVATGEAPLGIVYATDARAEKAVRVVGEFPEASHPPIVYPAGLVAEASDPAAATAYLAFLRSPEASAIFGAHGFAVPTPTN